MEDKDGLTIGHLWVSADSEGVTLEADDGEVIIVVSLDSDEAWTLIEYLSRKVQ